MNQPTPRLCPPWQVVYSEALSQNPKVRLALAQLTPPPPLEHQTRSQRRTIQSREARQLLDAMLGQHWGTEISPHWQVDKAASGQPLLRCAGHRQADPSAPAISLSHSGQWIACGAAQARCLGIDVERVHARNWEAVATLLFHPTEKAWVFAGSAHQRDERALLCWCRKEALGKALGQGLNVAACKIAFSAEGDLLQLPSGMGSPLGWNFHSQVLGGEVVVAAAWK